jgi:HEAT repeat protein
MPNLVQWLKSSNHTVVIFALKLAFVYQQYEVHNAVVECLEHENEAVRVQAVTTLSRIAREDTAKILANHYQKEHFTNRQNILNCLLSIASDKEKNFLITELDDQNDFLKVAAARVLAKCCPNGLEILVNKARQQPDPYQNIYFHIKSELQF